jgi:predicted DNA repair protein MutK
LIEWLVGSIGYGIIGVILGGIIVAVHHRFAHKKAH